MRDDNRFTYISAINPCNPCKSLSFSPKAAAMWVKEILSSPRTAKVSYPL